MSESAVTAGHAPARPALGVFERFLTVWDALCIIIGIARGQIIPGVFHVLGNATVAQVNLPVTVLVWQMIVPMLLKIDPAALREVGQHWRGIASTVGVNWFIKPLLKALLAWIFVAHLFRPYLPADQISSYAAGLILLAAAPCTAIELGRWRAAFHAEPDSPQRHDHGGAFAPIVGLLLRLSSITVPWDTLILSVVLYIGVPAIVAQLWRHARLARWASGIESNAAHRGSGLSRPRTTPRTPRIGPSSTS
jgi:arsenite transporter